MKELIHYRATIFVESPIGFTKDNVGMFPLQDWKCMPLPDNANSRVIDPFEDVAFTEERYGDMQWKAKNPEKGMAIIFLGQKIDIVGLPFAEEQVFLSACMDCFRAICDTYEVGKILRFAYCPTYGEKKGNFDAVLKVNSFKGVAPENVSLRNVFRVKENVNGKNVTINYLMLISSGFYNENGTILPSVIYDVDINSLPEEKLSFVMEDVDSFLKSVSLWANDFVNKY